MDPQKYKWPLTSWPESLCCVALHPPRTMTVTLPYACALTLGCLASLLVPPNGALDGEIHSQQSPEPRVASWFGNFGQINKYMEKLFNSSKKPQNGKKPSNPTKSAPSNTTEHPHLTGTNPSPRNTSKLQALEPLQPSASSSGPSTGNKEK